MTRCSRLSIALLAAGASMTAIGALPAAASPPRVVPNTAAGIVKIFHSPGIRLTNAIGRITTTGALTSYTNPSISEPRAIAAGLDGALWFINDGNNTIGRITTKGQITSYNVGFGPSADITAGPDGAMWFTNPSTNTIGRITTAVTPAIFSKTPASGLTGTKVTILGRNLRHATQVTFNGTPATIVSSTATCVIALVPHGATTGPISVTTPAGTTSQNGWFTVISAISNAR